MMAMLRETDPRLLLEEEKYQELRKQVCEELKIMYVPGKLRPKLGYRVRQ